MNNYILIIQSTRILHKDFTYLIESMRDKFSDIYYIQIDESHRKVIFNDKSNIKNVYAQRKNMDDRFEKFISLWKEISDISKNIIHKKKIIIIRSDFYISSTEFCNIIENESTLTLVNNFSVPYVPCIGKYFPKGHIFDGFMVADQKILSNFYNEIKATMGITENNFLQLNINTPKVNYMGKCPEYYLSESINKIDKTKIMRINLETCEWSFKKWGILDFIFRRPFFRNKT